ncbi:MAG: hypothetical protein K0M63_05475 [Weeksellaceae bacterium]|nr:hypothetical protein [Weeksellaceae bacterium]
MKKLILLLAFAVSLPLFAQQTKDDEQFIAHLKKDTRTDKNDRAVWNLLNDFYEEALQSDAGELNRKTVEKMQKLYADKRAKNMQILNLFMAYNNHISQTAAQGKTPDSGLQVDLMLELEKEMADTYGKVPAIVRIYKAEALVSNGQHKESADVISAGLLEYPGSVPLKVYHFLETNDERLKTDLIKNHPDHWMVKQFGIR